MDFKDDISIGGQLRVGTGICPAIKEGDQKINGSAMEGAARRQGRAELIRRRLGAAD